MRICRRAALMGNRAFSTSMLRFECIVGAVERVTPVVLIEQKENTAETTMSSCKLFASVLSNEGYSGFVLDEFLFLHSSDVDDAVQGLQNTIRQAGILPPILIASGIGAYVAQKYLESYPLKGLAMIDPPPSDILQYCKEMPQNNCSLIRSIVSADPSNIHVNLEAACVPMMLVGTSDAQQTIDQVAALHGISATDEESVIIINHDELDIKKCYNGTRSNRYNCLMDHWRVRQALLNWIDMLA